MKNKEASLSANLFNLEEWPNQRLREAVIRKLEDELARNPGFVPGNSQDVEELIFQKSKSQDDYRRRVQKFINVVTYGPGRPPLPHDQQPMGNAAAAAATSAAAPTTSMNSGQSLQNGHIAFFGTTNFAMDDVEMLPLESQNDLPFDPYNAVRRHQQQHTPAAAQALPQHLQQLQQQQQPMQVGGVGAPQQYNSYVHNPYQIHQQPAASNAVSLQPQAVAFPNEGALPAPGTSEYQMVYHNRLLGLRPYCERLRFKMHQYRVERNEEAAVKIDMLINVLEGRQVISLENLLHMERWILSKAQEGAI